MARAAWETLIKQHGFSTTEDVAGAANMNSGHVSQIANGKRDPRLRTALTLSRTIGCSLDALALAIVNDDAPIKAQTG